MISVWKNFIEKFQTWLRTNCILSISFRFVVKEEGMREGWGFVCEDDSPTSSSM